MLDDIAVVVRGISTPHRMLPFLRTLPSAVHLIVVHTSPFANLHPAAYRPLRTTVVDYRGGTVKALQVGAMMARSSWLLFSDMTTHFSQKYFDMVQDYHENDIVFGPVLPSDDTPPSTDGMGGLATWQRLAVPSVSDANLLVRSATFFKIGGFNTGLIEGQGAEFVERARELGFPATFRHDMIVFRPKDDLETLAVYEQEMAPNDVVPELIKAMAWVSQS